MRSISSKLKTSGKARLFSDSSKTEGSLYDVFNQTIFKKLFIPE